jgi:glycosyltransferase involved in cell wall biosynthesis
MVDGQAADVAIVNAYKAYTGSSSVARSYYNGLGKQGLPVRWYQCISSRDGSAYDPGGTPIDGSALFRDDLNLVLNSIFVFPRKIGRLKERLVFLTDPVLLGAAPRLGNSVLIVHDLRELLPYRRSWAAHQYFRWLFRRLRHVRHVICDSDYTRAELHRFYPTDVPVDVIRPCSGLVGRPTEHVEQSLARFSADRTLHLLCISADRPYKNIQLFYRLAKLLSTPRDGWTFRFRLISQTRPESAREIERLAASNLEVIPAVPDLPGAYDWADVLIHPSLMEGFGLPPVEAMQFGIPIVAADVPCLREIVETGGTLLDPGNPELWVSAILGMRDPQTYREQSRSSADRGREFTPDAFETRLQEWMRSRQP